MIADTENALGQYLIYQNLLQKKEADRILFMAIEKETLEDTLSDELKELLTTDFAVRFLIFDKDLEVIVQWQN